MLQIFKYEQCLILYNTLFAIFNNLIFSFLFFFLYSGNLPGLNFANHCFNPMGPGYKNYLRCDAMGHDIRFCQSKGVKVLLNIGGSVRFIGFASRNESLRLARNVWKLFLGGKDQAQEENIPRTFG